MAKLQPVLIRRLTVFQSYRKSVQYVHLEIVKAGEFNRIELERRYIPSLTNCPAELGPELLRYRHDSVVIAKMRRGLAAEFRGKRGLKNKASK